MFTKPVIITLMGWLSITISATGTTAQVSTDLFMGLPTPKNTPVVFAPDIVSSRDNAELNAIFHPNGKEFYFSREIENVFRLFVMHKNPDGSWSRPRRVELKEMDEYEIVDPWISPDGKQMVYISNAPSTDTTQGSVNLWVMKRENSGWGAPSLLPAPLSSDQREVYPVITNNGSLYFSSTRPGGLGSFDLYVARYENGAYLAPENLGKPINSANREGDIFVAPDERYIIASIAGREDAFGKSDLYISYKNKSGLWGEYENLGADINSEKYDYAPVVSPNGQYLFYTKNGNIYWVSTSSFLSQTP